MCGINGLFYFDPSHQAEPEVVHRMRAVAAHRGPDDHGTYFHGNIGLDSYLKDLRQDDSNI